MDRVSVHGNSQSQIELKANMCFKKLLLCSSLLVLSLFLPTMTEAFQEQKPRMFARVVVLAIGVETYASVNIPKADHSIKDAEAIAATLHKHFGYEREVLIGEKATKQKILERIEHYVSTLTEKDAFILFFAGHGQVIRSKDTYSRGFLIPHDAQLDIENNTDPSEWNREAIDMKILSEIVLKSKSKHVLVLLDACCSGFMTKRGNLMERPDLQQLASMPSRFVISATTEYSAAFSSTSGHGIFTKHLLAKLHSSEAQSTNDVFTEVRRRVAIESKSLMMPQLGKISNDDGEFVFIPLSIKETEIKEAVAAVDARALKRRGSITTVKELIEVFEAENYKFSKDADRLEAHWKSQNQRFLKHGVGKSEAERYQHIGATSDPIALAASTLTLARGLGVPKNRDAAFKAAQLAFDTEHPAGVFALATCHMAGIGGKRNPEAALKLIQNPVLKEFPLNDYLHAKLLFELEPNDPGTRDKALRLFERAHSAGMISARIEVIGLKHDAREMTDVEVVTELIPIADQGNLVAQEQIYTTLLSQPLMDNNGRFMCLHYLTKAAENGQKNAQYRLAEEFFRRVGFHSQLHLKQNYAESRKWATLAANQGHKNAHQILAIIYQAGLGVPHDGKKALEHYEMQKKLGADNQLSMQRWWELNAR